MEVSLGTAASKAMGKKILMGRPAPCTVKILMAVRAVMANHHPAMVMASPRVVMANSPCMEVMLSSRQDMEVTLHKEWQMVDMVSLLQTMAHQLAMDHPKVTDLHKGMVDLHKVTANSPNKDTDSLLEQGFVRPDTKGFQQQMAKMQMEKTGAGSIVVYLFSI